MGPQSAQTVDSMAETETYSFDLREVTIALIKQQDIHEGVWILGFEFGLGAGYFGLTKEDSRPSALIQPLKLQLTRQSDATKDISIAINAGEVNPPVSDKATPRRHKGAARRESSA